MKLPTKGELILKEGGKTMYTNTFQCKVNTQVKVCYKLVEPFARVLLWECTVQDSHRSSSSLVVHCTPVSDNEVIIECTPTASKKYSFTLKASGERVYGFSIYCE